MQVTNTLIKTTQSSGCFGLMFKKLNIFSKSTKLCGICKYLGLLSMMYHGCSRGAIDFNISLLGGKPKHCALDFVLTGFCRVLLFRIVHIHYLPSFCSIIRGALACTS